MAKTIRATYMLLLVVTTAIAADDDGGEAQEKALRLVPPITRASVFATSADQRGYSWYCHQCTFDFSCVRCIECPQSAHWLQQSSPKKTGEVAGF